MSGCVQLSFWKFLGKRAINQIIRQHGPQKTARFWTSCYGKLLTKAYKILFFIDGGHQSNQQNQFANMALKKPPSFSFNF